MNISLSETRYTVCRLEPGSEIPCWATKGNFFSVSRTGDELSIVCEQANAPEEVRQERDWRLFKVEGPLDFSLTGVLASLTAPLAEAKISIFGISTFDTDYLLVKENNVARTAEILNLSGFSIRLPN